MTLSPAMGVLVIGLGTMVVPFDSSVNVAFPYIVKGFGLPIAAIQWVVIAYTLTYAALTLVFGRIGDILGYRRIFLLGCAWHTIAFVLCSAAPTYGWLLFARVMQGIGAALALSVGPALATSLYPESQRTRVLGVYTMAFGVGGALGPVVAGQLVQIFDWPAVFWFRAPVAFAAFLLSWLIPVPPRNAPSRFDSAGAALLVVAISALLATLNLLRDLGQHIPWFSIAAAVLVASVIGFIVRQRHARPPLLNLTYFRDLDFSLVNGAHVLLNLAGFSVMLLVPFYLERVIGLPLRWSGLALACSPIGIMLSAPIAGTMTGRLSSRQVALIGIAAIAAAQVTIATLASRADIVVMCVAMFLQGSGLGLFQVAYADIATSTIPRNDRGVAGSLVMMTRTIGVVTGATVLMLMFQTIQAGERAAGHAPVEAFLAGFQATFTAAATIPLAVLVLALLRRWATAPRAD